VCKTQICLTQCYNCQQFGHVWVNCKQSPHWCGGGHLYKECPKKGNSASTPTSWNCKLVDGEEPKPSKYQSCRHAKEEMRRRNLQRATETTTERVLFSSGHTTLWLSFTAALRNNTQQQQQPQPPSLAQTCLAIVGEMSTPLPWGTTNKKYEVRQFRLLIQTVRPWTKCSN
jgi:hypothetical protein